MTGVPGAGLASARQAPELAARTEKTVARDRRLFGREGPALRRGRRRRSIGRAEARHTRSGRVSSSGFIAVDAVLDCPAKLNLIDWTEAMPTL